MSSTQDFISAQRRLLNLYENGRNLSHEQMVRALDGLLGITQQMVRNRREEFRVANIEPGTPPHRAVSPEPVVEYRHAALLRRAEEARRARVIFRLPTHVQGRPLRLESYSRGCLQAS